MIRVCTPYDCCRVFFFLTICISRALCSCSPNSNLLQRFTVDVCPVESTLATATGRGSGIENSRLKMDFRQLIRTEKTFLFLQLTSSQVIMHLGLAIEQEVGRER